jgi:hypothetical protein
LQAQKARIPFANIGMIKLPDEVTDDQAILSSDIFPTGYMGAELAEIKPDGGGVRLRPGRSVRHRQRQAARRRPHLRRRQGGKPTH